MAGGLVWEKSDADLIVNDPEQASTSADFAFRNESNRSVTVVKVTTSCGCTTASLDKKTYAPGERGKIAVTVAIAGHTGMLQRFVYVATDDQPPNAIPAMLTVRLDIREYLYIEPRMVFWSRGDSGTEKTITCTAGTTRSVIIRKLEADHPDFTFRIETVEEGRKYLIFLKPVSIDKAAFDTLGLVTEVSGVGLRVFNAAASIK